MSLLSAPSTACLSPSACMIARSSAYACFLETEIQQRKPALLLRAQITLDRSLTYRLHLTPRVALLRRFAGSGWGAGATTLRTATLALMHSTAEYCAPVWCRSPHTRRRRRNANCDWMPASYTSGQPSNPRRHRTC